VKRIDSSCTPEKAAEAVNREFAAIASIRTTLGPALRDTLPEPFLVLPEAGVLVLQELPGVALDRLLRQKANRVAAPWHRAEICRIAQRVGNWLGQFHEATRQNPVEHDAAAFEARLSLQIEACAKCGLDFASAEELSRIAAPANRALHGTPLPAAARHGDFTVRNILIDGDRVAVVDFESFAERDTIYEDLSAFVTYMALLKSQPLYSSSALEAASAGFLRGYGGSLSSEVLNLYVLKAGITALAEGGPAKGMRHMLRFESLYTRQLLRLGSEPPARTVPR
jgi:Phosphotransferase enzyme family